MGSTGVAGKPTNEPEHFFFKDLEVISKNVNAMEKLLEDESTRTPNYALAKKLVDKYLEDCTKYASLSRTDLVIKCLNEVDKLFVSINI